MQAALLGLVLRRMEDRHVVAHQTLRLPRRRIVHRCHVALPPHRAHIRQHLEVRLTRQLQPPVPFARARAARQSFGRIAEFQIVRVEMSGLARLQGQRQCLIGPLRFVERLDAHFPGRIRAVDHPHEPLAPECIGSRWKEWYAVDPF